MLPRCTLVRHSLHSSPLRNIHSTPIFLTQSSILPQWEPDPTKGAIKLPPRPRKSGVRHEQRDGARKRVKGRGKKGNASGPPSYLFPTLRSRRKDASGKKARAQHLNGDWRPKGQTSASSFYSATAYSTGLAKSEQTFSSRENAPHLPSSLLYSRRVDGVLEPRANAGPSLEDVTPPSPQGPVATLAHGLERVLFSSGMQWLQEPRSRVYNFTTWLENVIPVKDFAFERIPSFMPSSRDHDLRTLAQREGRRYAGSTSSMTGLLGHIYYLISGDKPVDTSGLSDSFKSQPRSFTFGQRAATSVVLNYHDGVYLIDKAESDPGLASKNILVWMGTMLEKFLTRPPTEFLGLTRIAADPSVRTEEPAREAYRYAKSSKFITRSQLDCFDHRLPGTGVFDIKTRAALSIRHDTLNHEESSGYQISTFKGLAESFEKEYYDLIRSAFLKYSFQARIGNMDGVFVAYHNTKKIFGFQYIPLSEMDARLFGEEAVGDVVFGKCMQLLEVVLDEATREFPNQSVRLTAEKFESENDLKVFVEPADWSEAEEPRPVVQLNVTARSYIGEMAASGRSAVERSSLPWTLLWSVSKSALDSRIIRAGLTAARKRASFPMFLPRGVDMKRMEEIWPTIQFNPAEPVDVPFQTEMFLPAPRSVKLLRRLAQKGRAHLERTAREQEGKPKIVLGLPNDAEQVAALWAATRVNAEAVAGSSEGSTEAASVAGGAAVGGAPAETHEKDDATSGVPGLGATNDPRHELTTSDAALPDLDPALEQDGREAIPETTLLHLEEMLTEDQKRILEGENAPAADNATMQPSRHHFMPRSRQSSRFIEELKAIINGCEDRQEPMMSSRQRDDDSVHNLGKTDARD
ncbi:mitochondrial protein Pet127-domain-containing protein [Gloeopeniophorella convolvens]|nr:mitochondrial protein Pet127-domain-containing protein [Gloeopeniophorella convolvens]